MKGQVKITLKSPQGDIVKEVNQTNRVFDIPKILMTEIFPLTVQNVYKCNTDYINVSSSWFNCITNIKDWFRGIKINDERFEEDANHNIVDNAYKDWKIPQLCGGENLTLANSSNLRYTPYNTAYSSETNNLKKLYYSWTVPEAFTMRSINLCHYDAVAKYYGTGSGTYYQINDSVCYNSYAQNSTYLYWKYGNFYFGYSQGLTSKQQNYSGNKGVPRPYSCLFSNPVYNWSNKRFEYTNNLSINGDYAGSSYTSNCLAVYPLFNNELLLFRNYNDATTQDTTNDRNCCYIVIIDNETGNVKRSFDLNQFENIPVVNYQSASWLSYYMNIVSTANKNFLIVYGSYKYYNTVQENQYYRIYEIPSTQNTLPIPCVATRCQETSVIEGKTYYTRSNNVVNGSVPGALVDSSHYVYTPVENPTGNPYSNKYYEMTTEGLDGTRIPEILCPELEGVTLSCDYTQVITNHLIIGSHIITFNNDGTINYIKRYITNSPTNCNYAKYLSRYLGRTTIPGLQYGLTLYGTEGGVLAIPIWYNTSCINLDEDIEVPANYTLTVEYTITAN